MIKQIRIIKDMNDKPKGFGYVEFNNQVIFFYFTNNLSQVNMMNAYETFNKKLQIDLKRIDISPADTSKAMVTSRNFVVFLNNLSFDVQEQDIKDYFKGRPIQEIEIARNARGISRGFAFVEFSNLNDLSHVLDMKTGILKGREFTISKSKREITHRKNEPLHNVLSKKDAEINIPEEKEKKKENNQSSMKSNDDFRKMLLK